MIEHGGSGSKAAAPLAKKLIKKILDRHELREKIRKDLKNIAWYFQLHSILTVIHLLKNWRLLIIF